MNTNNKQGYNNTYGDDLFLKSTGLNTDWSVDFDETGEVPVQWWDEFEDHTYNIYYNAYSGVAQAEYEISSEMQIYNLFESNTLLGEYTATDESQEEVTRTVGWLKFIDTKSNEYVKQFGIYEKNGAWHAEGNELSNEPTIDEDATYTIKDENGNDEVITVSFDSYTANAEKCCIFTANATKGSV